MCEFRVLEEEWIAQWCDSDETTIGCQPVGCQQVSKWDFDLPWIGRIRRQPSAVTVTPFRAELINTNFLSGRWISCENRWISCENRWASCERNNDVIPESHPLTHVLPLTHIQNTFSCSRSDHWWNMRLVTECPMTRYTSTSLINHLGCLVELNVSQQIRVSLELRLRFTHICFLRKTCQEISSDKSNDANKNAYWCMISCSFRRLCGSFVRCRFVDISLEVSCFGLASNPLQTEFISIPLSSALLFWGWLSVLVLGRLLRVRVGRCQPARCAL